MANFDKNINLSLPEVVKDLQDKLDAIPDLLFEVEINGRILSYHSPRTDLLFVPEQEFLGKLCTEILPADAAEVCMRAIATAHEKGFSSGEQYQLNLPKGICWFELSVSKKTDLSSDVPKFILLARDITDRKNLEHSLSVSEERLRSVFKSISEGIVIQDAHGEVIDANEAAEKILGLTRSRLIGISSLDPRWRAIYEDGTSFQGDDHPSMVTLRTGEPVYGQVMGIYTPENKIRWININSKIIDTDAQSASQKVVTTFVDITERKNTELALKKNARALKVLSDFNELLVKTEAELDLLHSVCRLLVDSGNYIGAWVQFGSNDEITGLRTVAQFGIEEATMGHGNVSWNDAGCSPNPALESITSGKAVVRNYCQQDSLSDSRGGLQTQDNFGTAIALPLTYQGHKFGALMICARQPDSFSADEVTLLHKLADNLSYGIETIRMRTEKYNNAILHESVMRRAIEAENNLVKISETTLRRLGQELHDDLGQLLTGSAMLADVVYHRLLENASDEIQHVNELRGLLQKSMTKIRTISHGLYPVEFDRVGLVYLLGGLARQVELASAIKVHYTHSRHHLTLLPEQSLHFYRIAQEAMNNSVRHSQATEISLSLKFDGNIVTMRIADNGIGMEKRDENIKGIGLLGMHSRVIVLGATLAIENIDPGGVCIEVTLPLPK